MISSLKLLANRHIAFIAFLLSFCLSPWYYHPWRVINSDGVLYLQLAYQTNTQGLSQTFNHYNWPFFSIIIASFQKITHLSYVNAAFILEAFFMGFAALFFVKIVEKFGGEKLTQWLAILVFLSFETLIDYRANIFRDLGYLAFFLSSFYFLLQFAEATNLKNGLFWFFSALIAMLFRVEGIAVFALAPLVVLFFRGFSIKENLISYLKLYFPICLLIIGTVLLIPFNSILVKQETTSIINDAFRLFATHWGTFSLFDQFKTAIYRFSALVLPKTAKDGSAFLILFIGLTGYFICKLTWTVGGLNFILFLSSWMKKIVPFKENKKLTFYWLLVTSLLIPYNFLLEHQFISTRYLISTSITILCLVPFSLAYCATHFTLPIRSLFTNNFFTSTSSTPRFFTLKNFFILYLIFAVGDFIYLSVKVFYSNTSTHNVQANIWLYENKANLPNFCSTDSWLGFAVVGEKVSDSNVDSKLTSLLDQSSQCQYIAFMATPSRMNRLKLLQESPDWKLYKTFPARSSDRSIYIFIRNNTNASH